MRWLDRQSVTTPHCLGQHDAEGDTWDALTYEERAEIREQLGIMQRRHCAYCERELLGESQRPHIEHFEQRSRAPEKTFDWANLFWSCSQKDHCGKRKDSLAHTYGPADLLKPDVDDPREFLRFYSDGTVKPRPGISTSDQARAAHTIRVFGLDLPGLRNTRRAYLAGPHSYALQASLQFSTDDAAWYLQSVSEGYQGSPFSAAIHDVLDVG